MKKLLKRISLFLPMAMLFCSITAVADAKPSIVSVKTNENSISVFVKNSDGTPATECLVGNKEATVADMSPLSALSPAMETLVLLDNSASISKTERTKITAFLSGYVSQLPAGEKMSLATFTDKITYLCDFTDDKNALNTCVNGITFQNQDAFLADILYELLSNGFAEGDVYRRIVVISDGADNAPIGYTETEMNNLLQKSNVPIYSLGCTSNLGASLLQNMFSFSRMTQGETFLLADYNDVSDICAKLMEDIGIIKYVIQPDAASMDGSEKPVQLTISGSKIKKDCRMPQVGSAGSNPSTEEPEVGETVISSETASETSVSETSADKDDKKDKNDKKDKDDADDKDEDNSIIIYAVAGGAALLLIIIIIVVLATRKKKSADNYDDYSNTSRDSGSSGNNDSYGSNAGSNQIYDDERTDILDNRYGVSGMYVGDFDKTTTFRNYGESTVILDDGDKTVMLDDEYDKTVMLDEADLAPKMPTVSLTDVDSPSRMFMFPVNGSVVVGRNKERADVVVDYDPTVSGEHFRLTVRDKKYYIENLSKVNITRINDQKIEVETEVLPGAIITLGRVKLKFDEC